jgi:GNAT superfamily N-acetyltransferase
MRIAFAESEDLDYLAREDHHVQRGVIEQKIERREIVVLHHDGWRAGALRYGYFWDEIPFMNLLWVQEELRGRGFGTRLVAFWEDEMRKGGYEEVMTSTLSSERSICIADSVTKTVVACSCLTSRWRSYSRRSWCKEHGSDLIHSVRLATLMGTGLHKSARTRFRTDMASFLTSP